MPAPCPSALRAPTRRVATLLALGLIAAPTVLWHGGLDPARAAGAPPVANTDSYNMNSGATIVFNPLLNDTGAGPLRLTYVGPSNSAYTATWLADGTVTLTAKTTYSGWPTIPYTFTAADGQSAFGTFSITIRPVAKPDAYSVPRGATTVLSPVVNDYGAILANSLSLTIPPASGPSHGTATLQNGNRVAYTPAAGFAGTDSFVYRITSSGSFPATTTGRVTITVAPQAVDDTATVGSGSTRALDVLANDSISTADLASVTVTVAPNHGGTATPGPDGTVAYTPSSSYSGPEQFSYRVSDTVGNTTSATVRATVTPVAHDDTAVVASGAVALLDVLANDTGSAPTTSGITSAPSHGSASVNPDGTISYTPSSSYSGPDQLSYATVDAQGTSAPAATVLIDVTPTAVADAVTVLAGGSVAFVPTANDHGSLDVPATTLATDPAHGAVTVGQDGSFIYTPAAGFSGADTFRYSLADSTGRHSTATVTVQVGPVAVADAVTTTGRGASTFDVLPNDLGDLDGTTVTITAGPAHGSAVAGSDGTVAYTPAAGFSGVDQLTYQVLDHDGTPTSAVVTITVPDPAVALDDSASGVAGQPFIIDVLGNDGVADRTGYTVALTAQPEHGTAEVLADGRIRYSPAGGYAGADTLSYSLTAPDGTVTAASVAVTVAAPVAQPIPPVVVPVVIPETGTAPAQAPVTVAAPAAVSPSAAALPRTGTDSARLALGGWLSIGVGAALGLAGRRRRTG